MKSAPITPARWHLDAEGRPYAPDYDDVYHPASGAFAQAQHVFLRGNGLPERWRQRTRFVILETGFGLGNNFLATWDAWRQDAQRGERLHFISVEKHPLTRDDLARVHAASPVPALAHALVAAWPPSTHDLHRLVFDGGCVQLSLALGDALAWLPELVAEVDAFYLDGFAPARNPALWEPAVFDALARLAAPGATLATWTAAHAVRDGLAHAGFQVRRADGQGGKRDITLADFAPRFRAPVPPARRRQPPPTHRHALVVGAGLAGCAAAHALAEQGWTSTVLDALPAPAGAASGNPAGLFHGIVNRHDGAHARFNRAAALQTAQAVREAIARHAVPGRADGMLRLEDAAGDVAQMQAELDRLGLPGDYVRAVRAAEAEALAGLPLGRPAWFYPGGGWVDPARLARAWLEDAGSAVRFRGGVAVHQLRHDTAHWMAIDGHGDVIATAETVVLAGAQGTLRLLGEPDWPLAVTRGQVSIGAAAAPEARAAPPALRPVSGGGYLVPLPDGRLLFGSTAQPGDTDPTVRDADHAENLAKLERLIGPEGAAALRSRMTATLLGRTGFRLVANDRLPLIGPVPLEPAHAESGGRPLTQPRQVPRRPGLFVFSALGSRGITWATLGARVLAAAVSGAPQALESSLLDAVDPARFDCRRARRR